MTIEEASARYQIPMEILLEYARWEFCGAAQQGMGARQYDDTDLERLSTVMTLRDIGFTAAEVETYMRLLLEEAASGARRLRMLEEKRGALLEEIHCRERRLQRLDCLRHALRTARGE